MVLSNIAIFMAIGIALTGVRNALINDFLSGGLLELQHMSENDVKGACAGYAKRPDRVFPVLLTMLQQKRLKALIHWVKDRVMAQGVVSFLDRTTQAQVNGALVNSLERETTRKAQKKIRESFHNHTFNVKLKSQSQ